MKLNRIFSAILLSISLALFAGCSGGCKSHLETGGAYAQVNTNADGTTNVVADLPFEIADQSYKTAYDIVDGVLAYERNNRTALLAISPKFKADLDKVRPVAKDIDHRWAVARQAYKMGPSPTGLKDIAGILSEFQRLVPVVLAARANAPAVPSPSK